MTLKSYRLNDGQLQQLQQCEYVFWCNEKMYLADVTMCDGRVEPAVFVLAQTHTAQNPLFDFGLRKQSPDRIVEFPHGLIGPSSRSLPFNIFEKIQLGDYSAGPWTDMKRLGLMFLDGTIYQCLFKDSDKYFFVEYPPFQSKITLVDVVIAPEKATEIRCFSPCCFPIVPECWPEF